MSNNKTPLEFFTREEITDELRKRLVAFVLITMDETETGNTAYVYEYVYHGSWATCLGLTEFARDRLLQPPEDL